MGFNASIVDKLIDQAPDVPINADADQLDEVPMIKFAKHRYFRDELTVTTPVFSCEQLNSDLEPINQGPMVNPTKSTLTQHSLRAELVSCTLKLSQRERFHRRCTSDHC